jgi:high affinity Mn2+ porin
MPLPRSKFRTLPPQPAPTTARERRRRALRRLPGLLLVHLVLLPGAGWADDELAAPKDNARWMVHGQVTAIGQGKSDVHSPYQGPNSLRPGAEVGHTVSATLFLGARPWRHTEVFVDPEAVNVHNISGLHGLGGLSNGEAQKGEAGGLTLFLARAFVRQSIPLGESTCAVSGGPHRFATTTTCRRLLVAVGKLSPLDQFDDNDLTHDARTQFLNWALLTYGAFDYPSDARGYSYGLSVEYDQDAWAFRVGRFLGPKESNGLALDFRVLSHYGDVLEVAHEHRLLGRAGSVHVLGFRNRQHMASFDEAVAATMDGASPSLSEVRRDQAKLGLGLALDQTITGEVRGFSRLSWSDGKTETYAFAEIDRSFVLGAAATGTAWHRPGDVVAAAWVANGLSPSHRNYLSLGGSGFFLGDGHLNYRAEQIIEGYYAAGFAPVWLALDFQHVRHPAYNADRGPVSFLGARLHVAM